MNPKKTLSKEDKEFFLNIKWEDITLEFLQGIFADKYDPIKKKIVQYKYNDNSIEKETNDYSPRFMK